MFWIIAGLVVATVGVIAGSYRHQQKIQVLERRILLLASQRGRITFVDVVRECETPPDLARQLLDDMGLKGHLSPQVTKEGAMVYRLVDAPADESRPASGIAPPAAAPLLNAPPASAETHPHEERGEPHRESVR